MRNNVDMQQLQKSTPQSQIRDTIYTIILLFGHLVVSNFM